MGRTSVVPDDSTVGRRGSPADPEAYNEFRKRAISLFSEQIQRLQAHERGLASLELFCGDLKGLLDRAQLVPPSIFRGDNEGRFAATVKILKDVLSVCTADLARFDQEPGELSKERELFDTALSWMIPGWVGPGVMAIDPVSVPA